MTYRIQSSRAAQIDTHQSTHMTRQLDGGQHRIAPASQNPILGTPDDHDRQLTGSGYNPGKQTKSRFY